MERYESKLDLPGFRFHPTEEELLDFYLKHKVNNRNHSFNIIGTINLYSYDPCELPGLAKIGEREWYFFVPRDRRQSSGGRPNRTTKRGFWKATGSDRPVRSAADPKRVIGLKKTLVYYTGRAPRGSKTDWVMNEYRLPGSSNSSVPPPHEDIVLCKIYKKATPLKELEHRAAIAEARSRINNNMLPAENTSSSSQIDYKFDTENSSNDVDDIELLMNQDGASRNEIEIFDPPSSAVVQPVVVPELQIPNGGFDYWMQDVTLWSPYANLLNF